jgi:hypothetical protein
MCGGQFYSQPLAVFKDMPDAAQFMPTEATLDADKGTDLEVYQCSSCDLVQLSCQPVYYYREVVRSVAFSTEMREFRMNQLSAFIREQELKGKSGVEIGCGRGEYLELLLDNGLVAHGLEYSLKSVQTCCDQGYSVSQGFIDDENYRINETLFSAFFMFNFLEHLPEPKITLRGISNNLIDNAVGLIEVPNFDMILESGLFSEFIHDHLFYFTSKTLTSTLNNGGFDVLDCQPIWHDYIISATVRKKTPTDVSLLIDRQKNIKYEVNEFVRNFSPNRVAIWGAGHQSLVNISLLNLSNVIAYVVDSAPFKQGKFTPATHLSIVSPETLKTQPVDGVLVMAASYSDEVVQILRRDFDPEIKIAVLRDYGLENI